MSEQQISVEKVYLVAIGGMVINSFISPTLALIIKTGMPAPVVTFYRLFLVSLIMLPTVFGKKEYRDNLRNLGKTGWLQLSAYSITKAGGFLLWAEALRMGTPAFTMTTLSNMAPIFVVVFAYIFLKEKTSVKSLLGIGICLIGVTVISIENVNQLGNFSSMWVILACCISNSLNTISGRVTRQKMEIVPMMGISYFFCAILSGVYALTQGFSFAIPREAILPMLGLSWGCTMFGHSISIWSLKYIRPVSISVLNLASPFFTAITAFFLLGEVPKPIMFVGAIIMVAGLFYYQRIEYQERIKITE